VADGARHAAAAGADAQWLLTTVAAAASSRNAAATTYTVTAGVPLAGSWVGCEVCNVQYGSILREPVLAAVAAAGCCTSGVAAGACCVMPLFAGHQLVQTAFRVCRTASEPGWFLLG
jgi:hypothetical protein